MEIRPSSSRPPTDGWAEVPTAAIPLRRILAFTRASSSRMEKGLVI